MKQVRIIKTKYFVLSENILVNVIYITSFITLLVAFSLLYA